MLIRLRLLVAGETKGNREVGFWPDRGCERMGSRDVQSCKAGVEVVSIIFTHSSGRKGRAETTSIYAMVLDSPQDAQPLHSWKNIGQCQGSLIPKSIPGQARKSKNG